MRILRSVRWALGALLAAACLGSQAQTYPDKPVTLVVPAPAASFSDIVARVLVDFLSRELGQPVMVDNRGGASGAIAYSHVAKAAADGYTMLLTNLGPSAVNVELFKKVGMPYDPVRDFENIAFFCQTPLVLVVKPDAPWSKVQDLVDDAKKSPGRISYATTGPGQLNHLSSAFLNSTAGIDTLHVPYKSGPAAMTDILAGRVDFMFYPPANVTSFVASGKLKALGATGAKRTVALPDVPTLAELGYPQFDLNAWYGLAVAARTPAPVVERLRVAMRKVGTDPQFLAKLHAQGIDDLSAMQSMSPGDIRRFHASEIERWAKIVQLSGATAER